MSPKRKPKTKSLQNIFYQKLNIKLPTMLVVIVKIFFIVISEKNIW